MSKDTSWAYALQPGDKAAIRLSSQYHAPYDIITFSRATATQLVFDAGTHREKRVGKSDLLVRGGGGYRRVEQCTDAVREATERWGMINKIISWSEADLKRLSTHYLSIIVGTFNAGHPQKEPA